MVIDVKRLETGDILNVSFKNNKLDTIEEIKRVYLIRGNNKVDISNISPIFFIFSKYDVVFNRFLEYFNYKDSDNCFELEFIINGVRK